MNVKKPVLPITMISINANTVGPGGYTVINPDGLDEACVIIRIINRCKDDMTVSFDGATAHDYIKSDGEMQIPAPFQVDQSGFRKLTKVYVKGTQSTGLIHLCGYYQPVADKI